MANVKTLIFILTLLNVCNADDQSEVVTNSGPVRGTTVKSYTGKDVDVFYGLPYAQPPIGHLRFRPPVEVKPWTETLDATLPSLACYQRVPPEYKELYPDLELVNAPKNWSEDCLKIHIWVPKPRPTNSTVMVYIHGGAYFEGDPLSPEHAGTTIAAEENVIIASMNYRLDVQGFMTLSIPEAPGNVGLMDQQLALKWIHNNIASFGGNHEDITIFGLSAGSASVGFQIVAPESRGLFHRAIMMSGAPVAPWANRDKDEVVNATLAMADFVGCTNENRTKVLYCLESVDPDRFIDPEWDWRHGRFSLDHLSPGGPIVDDRFITDRPIHLLEKKEFNAVDLMIGVVADEGSAFLALTVFELLRSPDGKTTKHQFEILLNSFFKRLDNATRQSLTSLYVNVTQLDDPDLLRDAIKDMVADYFFNCPCQEFADVFTANSGRNVYRYVVDHSIPNSFGTPEWMGTVHGMDMYLHMGIAAGSDQVADENIVLSKKVMKWWANFARTGNPNDQETSSPVWPESTVQRQEYLEIGLQPVIKNNFRAEQCALLKAFITSATIITP